MRTTQDSKVKRKAVHSPISNGLDAESPTNSRKKNKVKKPKTKSAEKVSKDLELGTETPQEEDPAITTATEVRVKITSEDSTPLEDPKPTERKTVINQSGGPSWTQKSSWKDLVGEMTNSTFSLTQIFGSASSGDSEQKNLANPVSDFFGEGWKVSEVSKDANQKDKVSEASGPNVANSECEGATLAGSKGEFNLFGKISENKNVGKPNKKVKENVVAAKIPPFMKSEASMKEFLKLKKSLSGSKKRNKGEKN